MITVYSRPGCTYCEQSKNLLESRGIEYNELMLDVDITVDQLKLLVPGAKSVPQILDDGILIGGFHQLVQYLDVQHLSK
jgi:glutathione-dependent peroxiredoxin